MRRYFINIYFIIFLSISIKWIIIFKKSSYSLYSIIIIHHLLKINIIFYINTNSEMIMIQNYIKLQIIILSTINDKKLKYLYKKNSIKKKKIESTIPSNQIAFIPFIPFNNIRFTSILNIKGYHNALFPYLHS